MFKVVLKVAAAVLLAFCVWTSLIYHSDRQEAHEQQLEKDLLDHAKYMYDCMRGAAVPQTEKDRKDVEAARMALSTGEKNTDADLIRAVHGLRPVDRSKKQ